MGHAKHDERAYPQSTDNERVTRKLLAVFERLGFADDLVRDAWVAARRGLGVYDAIAAALQALVESRRELQARLGMTGHVANEIVFDRAELRDDGEVVICACGWVSPVGVALCANPAHTANIREQLRDAQDRLRIHRPARRCTCGSTLQAIGEHVDGCPGRRSAE